MCEDVCSNQNECSVAAAAVAVIKVGKVRGATKKWLQLVLQLQFSVVVLSVVNMFKAIF